MPTDPKEPKGEPKSEAKAEKSETVYRYVAKHGEYLHGIPTRDLTEDDLKGPLKGIFTERRTDGDGDDKTKDVTRKVIEASGLYEKGGS